MNLNKYILTLLTAGLLSFGASSLSAQTHEGDKAAMSAPKSVMHIVTVTWKPEATPEQIQAALDGVKTIAKDYPGVTRVWIKTLKAQGERTHAFVMEFVDQEALKNYADSDAQKAWYKLYLPVRARSTTFAVTNE